MPNTKLRPSDRPQLVNVPDVPGFREAMKGDPERVRQALTDAWTRLEPRQCAVLFCRETSGFDPYDLGWRLFPALDGLLRENDGLFGELCAMLASESLDSRFRIILMDALDRVVRRAKRKGDSADRFWNRLLQVAEYPREPDGLRVRALRTLSRDRRPDTLGGVLKVMKESHGGVFDAGARVVAAWRRAGIKLPKEMEALCLRKTKALLKEGSFPGPGLLKALAAFGTPGARILIGRLPAAAKTASQRQSLFALLGDRLPPEALKKMIQAVGETPSPDDTWALRILAAVRPKAVEELHRKKWFRESLLLERLWAGRVDPKASKRALSLRTQKNETLRRLAVDTASLLREDKTLADYFKSLTLFEAVKIEKKMLMKAGAEPPSHKMPVGNGRTKSEVLAQAKELLKDVLSPTGKRPKPGTSTSGTGTRTPAPVPATRVAEPFESGLELADGLYRNLVTKLTNSEHWHGAVYQGITPAGNGEDVDCRLVQVDGLISPIVFLGVSTRIAPSDDVAAKMKDLKERFLSAFSVNDPVKYPFQRAAHHPGMTHHQRAAIAATAARMVGTDIHYTAGDQLDYEYWDWDGSIADIDQSRCDGVVEYAYESQGVRVCSGLKADRWNIARAGTAYPENHNELHDWQYEAGDTCPRIQAGGTDNDWHVGLGDTALTPTRPDSPVVSNFFARQPYWPDRPELTFRLESTVYDNCYVRLTVRKGNSGPFRFLVTDDLYSSNALTGTWGMRLTSANTRNSHLLYWGGKTHDGTDFFGQDGEYEFRLVAVDHGGSVSACFSRKLTIAWRR